ncbi:cytidylate kinase family protein [Candidatus Woesearchaeota archaeon]|nr:cytidylate kinase family protein [Candidatus Woesearchaeota archaeon]
MRITIGGTAGSGKSTVAKMLANKLGYKHYSMGDFQREIAEEKKISLLELSKLEEEDRSIDEEVDQRQINLGRNEDNFVIDSRLGFHFIPNSVKIFLDANFEERAKRILADTIRKEHNINLENTKHNMKIRELSEKRRYQQYYNLDPYDKNHYDLIVDTTKINAEEAVEEILEFVKKKKNSNL